MGILQYLSRNPSGEPWEETDHDKKRWEVCKRVNSGLNEALVCIGSRLNEHIELDRNKDRFEHKPKKMRQIDESGCHYHRLVQNRTKFDMNENGNARNKTRRNQIFFSISCNSI